MAVWQTPKTDWEPNTPVNYKDYNRIKNNMVYLWEKAQEIWGSFSISDMGADIESYADGYYADQFNKFEENLETINNHMYTQYLGIKQTFYDNGVFISSAELNRIESGQLLMKQIIAGWEAGKVHLPLRLGMPKGLYI